MFDIQAAFNIDCNQPRLASSCKMRRKSKLYTIHRRKPVSTEPGPLYWGLTLFFVAGINMVVFNLSVMENAGQSHHLKTISRTNGNGSDFYQNDIQSYRLNHDILPTKLPPDSDATTAEDGVLWRYRLPDGVEFSLMQMPTSRAIIAGNRYTAAHR